MREIGCTEGRGDRPSRTQPARQAGGAASRALRDICTEMIRVELESGHGAARDGDDRPR
jgi:hypothetical protein